MVYEKFVQDDGSIVLDHEHARLVTELSERGRYEGSADISPVFFVGANSLAGLTDRAPVDGSGMIFARTLVAEYKEGVLTQEATFALTLASSAFQRSPQDGEWIAIRLLDSFPAIEDFMDSAANWLEALAETIKSLADAIIGYIEFLEARITDIQQLIRRITALIQALLGFTVYLPRSSGLVLVSAGTDGLVGDLQTAENKPSDSPLAYGAGIAIVAPSAPTFLLDLFLPVEDDGGDETPTSEPSGLEGQPAEAGAAPSDEPDVL